MQQRRSYEDHVRNDDISDDVSVLWKERVKEKPVVNGALYR